MKTNNLLVYSLIALVLSSCSNFNQSDPFQPESQNANLETWQESFPFQYQDWKSSIHGEAYLNGDQNAPVCIDCHSDPQTGEIETVAFQLAIPSRCGRCHSDQGLMDTYDLSSTVYETYLADYHGATVNYYFLLGKYEHYRPEAVCSDCHNNHDIYPASHSISSVSEENLSSTCQVCHREANENFTSSFNHYQAIFLPASLSENSIHFGVKLFYQLLIPIILGGMLLFIFLDIIHRLRKRK